MSQLKVSVVDPSGTVTDHKVASEKGAGADLIKKLGFLNDEQYQIRLKADEARDQILGDVLTAEALENLEIAEGDQIVVFPRVIGGC